MPREKLRRQLADLQAELTRVENLEPEAQHRLEEAIRALEESLNRDDLIPPPDDPTLVERLESSMEDFQKSHPQLTRLLADITTVLGEMGI